MFKYENCICPYCGEPLLETEDLAVCPDCGTPHHRACYKEHGQCANYDKHSAGFEWLPPVRENPDPAQQQPADMVACMNCGALSAAGLRFCDQCGAPLGYPRPAEAEGAAQQDPSMLPYILEEAIRSDQKMDGFSIKDWIVYIASNVGYYLYCFKVQDNSGRKFSFTWSAMLFPTAYFLYRKVWGAAVAAFGAGLLMRIPAFVTIYLLPLGINLGFTTAFWNNATNLFSLLSIAINFCWGMFAVYLYRRSAVRKMTSLRNNCGSEQEFSARLRTIGGPSWPAVLLLLAPFAILVTFMMMLMVMPR